MRSIGWKPWFAFLAPFLPACSGSHGGRAFTPVGPQEPFAFPSRSFVGPGSPGALARGDLDGDGVADVAVPLTDSTGVVPPSVVLSYLDRGGRLTRSVELRDAAHPREVAISDCDGDGRADVFVLDDLGEVGPGAVLVYLQGVDGAFGVPSSVAVGVEPIRLIAARWDGDGTTDLLTVNQEGHSVCVLPGHGDGHFEPARFTDHGVAGVQYADAGDLDRDGALDLALVHSYGGFVLLGSGDGRFGTPQPYTGDSYDSSVRVADLTGDGFPDILRTNCNGHGLELLEGDGAGSFAPGFTASGCFSGVALGDLDGDGVVDLLLGGNDGMTTLLGLGGGDFAPGATFSPGVGSQADLALWDADGDLDLDLFSVVSMADGLTPVTHEPILTTDLALLTGEGDGTFAGPGQYEAGPEARALTVGDFVRDGVPDLAVLQYPPSLSVLGGMGDGSFLAPIDTPLAEFGHVLASADLDGNTLEDVLVLNTGYATDEVELLSSTGSGTFDPPFGLPCGGFSPRAVRVADLDSNLFPDLVISNGRSNQIAVHLGTPGGFSQPLLTGVGASPGDLALDDLDGDGLLDAVVANHDDDSASVLIGNGDGTFHPAVAVPTLPGPQSLQLGDFDEDGLDDLAVACTVSGIGDNEILLLSGNGDGTFTSSQLVPDVAANVFLLTAADLDRDGLLDLVTASRFAVFVQLANGPVRYEPRMTFALDGGIGGLEVSDLDADGKADLVVAAGAHALVFLNQGP